MLRWIAVLTVLCLLTGLLATGLVPSHLAGLARLLCVIYAALLAGSVTVELFRNG